MGQSAIAKLSSDDVEEGDARYLAPELLNPDEYKEPLDLKKADIFSLGMTLLELATSTFYPRLRYTNSLFRRSNSSKWC